MAEILLSDPITLRRCILLECLSGESVWTCFMNFCNKLGNNAIEYQEFEYWFMRFSRKEYELDYNRSQDPPTRNIDNLPLEIMQKVLVDMNVKERLNSALVCKKLYNAVSTLKPPYEDLQVIIKDNSTYLFINHYDYFNYYCNELSEEGYEIGFFPVNAIPLKRYKDKKDYQEEALKDIHAFFNQPRLELKKLNIEKVSDKHWNDFGAIFEKLHQKVKIKEIFICTTDKFEELQILPYINPSFIEKIVLKIDRGTEDRIERIFEMEQCQNVKMIEFRLDFHRLEQFRVENFTKFKRFALQFSCYNRDAEKLMEIVKTLLTSTTLKLVHLDLYYQGRVEPIKTELDKITEEIRGNSSVRKFLIPNSKEYFEIEFIGDTVIRIERKR
ncbi:hypothetical protein CAEBREN_20419 [Caenorhabditis brenneri]|uniref:F-box domain-containing protein n=1 Tax=Caenorhabditis brenneri TaxID=135651 RepID=G0NN10_CAEBE|nr:hypothetical protein CAEBREN_20419 [Caenorhabditis brenneri]